MSTLHAHWKKAGLGILLFVIFQSIISYAGLSSFSRIILYLELDHPDIVDVYYSTTHKFIMGHMVSAEVATPLEKQRLSIDLKDQIARRVRLDLGRNPGQVKLFRVELRSYFGEPIVFEAGKIQEFFRPNEGISSYELKEDHIFIRTTTGDPYISYQGPALTHHNMLMELVLPAILAFAFTTLFTSIGISSIPAISDIEAKTSSIGTNVKALDGIRGLAALMVLAEHTGVWKGIGTLGVWLFFSLSGFLLATPFIRKPEKAVSMAAMKEYVLRRMKRIMPMYYVFLAATFLFGRRVGDLFRHMIFIQGDGHLWTIPQEILFYTILPFIVLAAYWLAKINRWVVLLFLLGLIWMTDEYLGLGAISLYGYGTILRFRALVFIGGVLFAYLFHYLIESVWYARIDASFVKKVFGYCGSILFIVLVVFSARMIPSMTSFNPFDEVLIFGILAGVLIFCVVMARGTYLSRFMEFLPFRAVGIVSFSFYLLHPKINYFVKEVFHIWNFTGMSGYPIFLISGFLTYCCAVFTYSYIERPFLKGTGYKEKA